MFVTIWTCTQEWSLIAIRDDRVDVRDVPPALELIVGVDALDQRAQLPVAPDRDVDLHALDGFGGREPGLVLGLGVDRLLDPLRCLLVYSPRCESNACYTTCVDPHEPHPVRLAVEDDLQPESTDGLLPAAARDPALRSGSSSGRSRPFSGRFSTGSLRSFTGSPPGRLTPLPVRLRPVQRRTSAPTSTSPRTRTPAS